MKYSRQNFFSNTAIALSAFLSFTLLACNESNPVSFDVPVAYSEPAPESSSIASSSSEKNSVSPIEDMYSRCNTTLGIITDDCFSSKCDAENEGKVETKWIGNAKYGGNSYFRCEKGSWVKGDISLTCDTAGVQVGDICTKGPKLGIYAAMYSIPGSNTLRFIYKGDGVWKEFDPEKNMVADIEKLGKQCTAETKGDKGILEYGHGENSVVVFYGCDGVAWRSINPDAYYCTNANSVVGDTCSFESDGENSSSATELPSIECNLQNEGLYETVIDTVTVYPNGKVWDRDVYYHCESGEWVKTKCRDPQDACTSDNEGEYRDVVCYSSQGNPKSEKTEWTFKCMDNKWKKLSDEEVRQLKAEKDSAEVEGICNEQNKPEPKLGDVCSISRQGGNTAFGIVYTTLVCNVYTEDGWVAKWWGTPSEKSCEEILATPADTTPAE